MRDPRSRAIDDQIEYYRRRARERDEWIRRRAGQASETARPSDDPLGAEETEAIRALDEFRPHGDVLELACGTGVWTEHIVRHADTVTAVDASPEMLDLNRARVADPRVEYLVADILRWEPPRRFDAVVFAFWLSHVPSSHFESFWELVSRCLRPGGRVFFVDEGPHELWHEERIGGDVVRRRLTDGSEHRVVKVLWPPDQLERELRRMSWDVRVRSGEALYWGAGARA